MPQSFQPDWDAIGFSAHEVWEAHPDFQRSPGNPFRHRGAEHRSIQEGILRDAGGRIECDVLGHSEEGREIHHLTFGTGPVAVMIWSRQHGDEAICTAALWDSLGYLIHAADTPAVRAIAERLTLHIIPIANPDGLERMVRRNALGIDINRDGRAQQMRETQAMADLFRRVQPEVCFNMHDQDPRKSTSDTGSLICMSFQACPFDQEETEGPNLIRAKRISGLIARELEPWIGGHMARYEVEHMPRSFGDSTSRWGASTVLLESGGWTGDFLAAEAFVVRAHALALTVGIASLAAGIDGEAPAELYTALPLEGANHFDLLIRGGRVALGESLRPRICDVGINYPNTQSAGEEWVSRVADLSDMDDLRGRWEIDASGQLVVPGLIEVDPDFDEKFAEDRDLALRLLRRGITTVVGRASDGLARHLVPTERMPLRIHLLPHPTRLSLPDGPHTLANLAALSVERARTLKLSELGIIRIGAWADFAIWTTEDSGGEGDVIAKRVDRVVVGGWPVDLT